MRSLTKRQKPVKRRSAGEETISEYDDDEEDEEEKEHEDDDASPPTAQDQAAENKPPRPLSQASAGSLNDVNLDDDPATKATTTTTVPAKQQTPESLPEKSPPPVKAKTMSFSGLANALPSMPWSPPATDSRSKSPPAAAAAVSAPAPVPAPNPTPAPAPASTGRKFNSPFSWLSRSSSKEPPAVQITPSPRRNTASSVATMTSNPEMMLSKLEEEKDGEGRENGSRNTLKDRFKQLRLKGEAVPLSEDDKSGATAGDATEAGFAAQPPPSPLPPSPNSNLAPGTASGVTAGPSSLDDSPVDWDLWQSVVNEGPAAVARTSPEELNKAIATGIPNAIRGVIWQVLAQSKNEELEAVYHELVVRGTDKEKKDKDRQSSGTTISGAANGSAKGSTSSASSVHSENSGSNGAPSPTEKDSEFAKRAQAAAAVERQKKDKEDLAMLQKLEKTIRRDLGARTSFSKFAAAQGLQEGLFGVCKAYALFDEGVGYAQGMNFLAMPLLFNVSPIAFATRGKTY